MRVATVDNIQSPRVRHATAQQAKEPGHEHSVEPIVFNCPKQIFLHTLSQFDLLLRGVVQHSRAPTAVSEISNNEL